MKTIGILGSTGSVGTSCLDIVRDCPHRFRALSLTAGENVEKMVQQVMAFQPAFVSMGTERASNLLRGRLGEIGCKSLPEIAFGPEGMKQAATLPEVDVVLSSTVGVHGLPATYEALLAGKQMALANKEVLVAAGELITRTARERSIELIPVDSEHNGVHQCLRAGRREDVKRLVLTASGGPFLRTPAAELAAVTVEDALRHPTWNMGNRITIDSATLMNKGFEVIEARWLFGFSHRQIRVKVHPQSTVHSLVEFVDGSILAQLSITDMRVPIQYALSYPERFASNHRSFDWERLSLLEFLEPDMERFPCLRLAYDVLEQGSSYPCALNAADEVAVEAFLGRRIPFASIPKLIEDVLLQVPARGFETMGDVLEHDRLCRERARQWLKQSAN